MQTGDFASRFVVEVDFGRWSELLN